MIVLVPSDPEWVERFAVEGARLRQVLGAVARRIDHIGSTSVPGLGAKPIIDIQLSVDAVEDLDAYRSPIEDLGHPMVWDERPIGHVFFAARDHNRRFNVHVCGCGGDWERAQLLFRDWLRANPTEAAAYLDVKSSLAPRFDAGDVDQYAEAKSVWIKPAMARAEQWASVTAWRLPPSDA